MSRKVIFVGGASGSGKSTVLQRFVVGRGISLLQLDDLHRELRTAVRTDQLGIAATEAAALYAVRALLHAGGTALVEGGWVQPEDAQRLSAEFPTSFVAFFCGYPNVVPEGRLAELRKQNQHYLVRGKSDDEALRGIEKQIRDSRSYEARATERGFAFVDFSSFVSGSVHLEQLLLAQF